jgi:hypothetical protein
MVWNVMIYWFIVILICYSDASYFADDKVNVKKTIVITSLFQHRVLSEGGLEELTDEICPDKYRLCKNSQHDHLCVKTENLQVWITRTRTFPLQDESLIYICEKVFTFNPDIFNLFATSPFFATFPEPLLKFENETPCAVIGSNGDETQTRYFIPNIVDYEVGETLERIQKSRDWYSTKVNPISQIQYHVFCGEKEDIKNAVKSWYKKRTKQNTKVYYVVGFLLIFVAFCYGGCLYSAKCENDENMNDIQQQQHNNIFSRAKHFKPDRKQTVKAKKEKRRKAYTHQPIHYSDLEYTSENTTESKTYQFSSSSTFVMNIEDLKKIQKEIEQYESDPFINLSDLEYTSEKTVLTDSKKFIKSADPISV